MYEFKILVTQYHLDSMKPKDLNNYYIGCDRGDGDGYSKFPNFFIDLFRCHISSFISGLGIKVIESYYPSDYVYCKSWGRFEVATKNRNGQKERLAYDISIDKDHKRYFDKISTYGPNSVKPLTFTVGFTETKPFTRFNAY